MNDRNDETENGFTGADPFERIADPQTDALRRSALLSGDMLDGRFMIVRDLTEDGADIGGLGRVYIAKDTKLMGREVVVKVLQSEALENPDVVRKFEHEKEALIRLDHPNIVRILDSGRFANGAPFIVMEYIEGASLRRKLRQTGPLPFSEAASIIESTTEALAAAHSKGILHRDIKPENIMLTPLEGGGERVRLIDFGIARVENSLLAPMTEFQRGIGTILYVSPEQLRGIDEQTPASDLYSLAVVVYEILTGKLPFNPRSVFEMYEVQQEGVKTLPRTIRDEIPVAVEELILSGLRFEASERPSKAREFGRAIANALLAEVDFGERTVDRFKLPRTEPSIEPRPLPAKTNPAGFVELWKPEPERGEKFSPGLVWVLGFVLMLAITVGGFAAIAYFRDKKPNDSNANNANNSNNASAASKTILPGGLEMKFAPIPAGQFEMGWSGDIDDEKPVHTVKISRAFDMQTTEVTQQQWKAVMGSLPNCEEELEIAFVGDKKPVVCVSRDRAKDFIKRLNDKDDGFRYRLPTEAEWEYAARAGTTGIYAGDLDTISWNGYNSDNKTHDVATKQANSRGLYDMYGNVWEWCEDLYGPYPDGAVTDPKGVSSASSYVVRGGAWGNPKEYLRSTERLRYPPSERSSALGFRVVRQK